MTPDQLVAHELAKRLKRVRSQIVTLTAEAEMIERMMADAAKSAVVPRLKLRRNSKGKWTAQGQIRKYLIDHPTPARAQAMYEALKRFDPTLNASTFRSHLRRMVEDKTVKHEGPRGHYALVDRPHDEPREAGRIRLPRVTIGNDFLKLGR